MADGVPTLLGDSPLRAPVFIVVVWVKPDSATTTRPPAAARIGRRLGVRSIAGCCSVLVLTNARGTTPDDIANHTTHGGVPLYVVDAAHIDALLEISPLVVRRVPSLLGVRDLAADLSHEAAARSGWDVEAARELAHVFVPTHAYRSALAVLDRHHFAVLSGPPEVGKTAIARMLGLALQVEGWEVHECIRPEQIWQAFDRERRQLFVADDAFGSTEYHPDAAERWSVELPRMLAAMDGTHKLVWTSRPAPLKAGLDRIHREHGVERFPRPAEVYVDASGLGLEERATILLRHANAAGLSEGAVGLVRRHHLEIVRHPHFTPERIKRFVRIRLPELALAPLSASKIDDAIIREIAQPTEAMAASFAALPAEHRAVLVGLVDSPPGPVSERDLAAAARRHAESGLPRPPAELIDRLTDHFVRFVPPAGISWVHPSWRDLVIEQLAADAGARRTFLERCSLDGVLLALSRSGGTHGERLRPLLVDDGDWDALGARLYQLVPTLDDVDLSRLLHVLRDAVRRDLDRDRDELVAVVTTALRAIARCWTREQSFATDALLDAWKSVSRLLPDEVAPATAPKLWVPPVGERYKPPPDRHHAVPVSPVEWQEDDDDEIVARILSDLDAA